MHDTTPTKAGRREWIGLAVLALPALLTSLDIGALFLALPHLTADLNASTTQQLWITDIYGFLIAGFLITMGSLGDRIGRRRLLLIGAVVFGISSVLAAYSTTPEMLIATRALLGIAAATLMPSVLALITNMFTNPAERGKAIAILMSCLMTGSALGPVVGGLLIERFWWGSAFLLGVPAMVILLILGPILLPEYRPPTAGRLDLTSVVLSLAAILPIIYGLKELAVHGADALAASVGAIVVGAIFAFLFIRRQLTLDGPLVDLRMFHNRAFSVTLTAMLLASAGMGGTFLLTSQYVQSVLGLSPSQAGLWLAPAGLGIAVGSLLSPMLLKYMQQGSAMAAGLVVAAIGYLLLVPIRSGGGLALAVIGLAVIHLGAGPLFALGASLVVGSVPPERAGSAASMSETSNYLGTTLGMAFLGTIGAAIYSRLVVDHVPADLPAQAAETARETLAGAVSVAGQLPGGAAAELLQHARESFTTGLNTAAVVGLVLSVVLAAMIGVMHRTRGAAEPATPASTTPDEDAPLTGTANRP
ncbi:MFS transporter [Micromonospora gifhornensis]|uniref:MFS transporter n=1 Tax=Micromonospora gifhornensis TaxID=84594 RepID=UPI003664AD37